MCARAERGGEKRGKEIERGKLYGSRFKKETEVAESYRRSGSKTFEILDHFYEAVRKEVRRIVYHEGRKKKILLFFEKRLREFRVSKRNLDREQRGFTKL